jgi:hypothetical protein
LFVSCLASFILDQTRLFRSAGRFVLWFLSRGVSAIHAQVTAAAGDYGSI